MSSDTFRQGLDDFFSGSQFSIEPHGPGAVERHSIKTLSRVGQLAKRAALISIIATSSLAGIVMAQTSQNSPASHEGRVRSAASATAQDYTNLANSSISPHIRSGGLNVKVSFDAINNAGNTSPASLHQPHLESCSISLKGLVPHWDHLTPQNRGSLDRLRQAGLTTLHEAAHCEAGEFLSDRLPALSTQARAIHGNLEAMLSTVDRHELRADITTLTLERQADAKALLYIAYILFEDAVSPNEMTSASLEFDAHVNNMLALRAGDIKNTNIHASFNGHDTSLMIRTVSNFVHDQADQGGPILSALVKPENSLDLSWKLAVASVHAQLDDLRALPIYGPAQTVSTGPIDWADKHLAQEAQTLWARYAEHGELGPQDHLATNRDSMRAHAPRP